MNIKELLDEIAEFRQKIISKRDAEIKQFDENCNAFIKQVEELGLFDVEDLRMRQEKVKHTYLDVYQPYLDALDKKENEIKMGKMA